MELHILEHRVRVLSLARPGLWLYTHPLIKLLFLPRRSRAAPVRVPASGRGHVAGAECVVSQRCGRTGRRGHQDRPISDRTAGRAPRVRADAVHLPDRLHPGAGAGPVRGDPHAGPGIRHLPRGGRRACACCQGRFQQWLSPCPACPPREAASGSPGSSSITFFAFSLIEGYISIVMDAETQKKFPSDLLLTSSSGELWRMVRIGGQPLGFDECGIVAQIAGPLAAADISAYYISTFNFDHALVPEDGIGSVIEVLQRRQDGLGS
ncbi:cytosolic arginine sensor for mTORC1 subunit 1 isoform X4 [Ovis aries]|uniref:cytosolic arginine sensor for mTORC1 subunit 1 isoform X4 n=1 Tax=Ovis aries TaxID=9940 RepID=UPI001C2EA8CB|nr:cytosolic arginine sensor for mTORC1 subunit 1 isoform X4 [Ovis aries]